MNIKLAVVSGDGIGPEVVGEALKVLDKVGEKYGHTFEYNKVLDEALRLGFDGYFQNRTSATSKYTPDF